MGANRRFRHLKTTSYVNSLTFPPNGATYPDKKKRRKGYLSAHAAGVAADPYTCALRRWFRQEARGESCWPKLKREEHKADESKIAPS